MVIPPNPNAGPHDFNDASDWTPWQRRYRGAPSLTEVESRATAALRQRGYDASGLKMDGTVFRFSVEGDSGADRTGWGIVYADEWANMVLGNWREGEKEVVPLYDERAPLSLEERHARDAEWKRQKEAREKFRQAEAVKARERAAEDVAKAGDASGVFPYLVQKGVPLVPGLKSMPCRRPDRPGAQPENALIVPLRNAMGELVSYQRIFPDGAKFHLAKAEKKGAFFLIPPLGEPAPDGQWLYVCEGLATGISIAEAWPGIAVACACDCHNIRPVLEGLKAAGRLDPARTLVVADNDWATARRMLAEARAKGKGAGLAEEDCNPGVKAARDAAGAVGCRWCAPVPDGFVSPNGEPASDANDLVQAGTVEGLGEYRDGERAKEKGLEALREALAKAWGAEPEEVQEPAENAAPASAFSVLDEIDRFAPGNGVYEGAPPERDWCIEPLFEHGEVGVFAGPGGSGKSTLATQAVFAVGTGTPWLGLYQTGEPRPAWYLTAEESQRTLHRRQWYAMNQLLSRERKLAMQNVRLVSLRGGETSLLRLDSKTGTVVPGAGWVPFCRAVRRHRPRLVILDPFTAVTYIETVQNELIAQCIRMLEPLAEEVDASFIYLHHVPKKPAIFGDRKTMNENMNAGSVLGGGQVVNAPRWAALVYPLTMEFAGQCVQDDGRPIQADGEVVVFKEVKKNGGRLEPRRYFRHTDRCGLLEACLHVKEASECLDEKVRLKRAEKTQELDAQAEELAQEVVRVEQTPGAKRISPSYAVEAIRAGAHNAEKAKAIAFIAERMGFVRIAQKKELSAFGRADKGSGAVLVPTIAALDRFGQPDPDRPGEFAGVPSALRQWLADREQEDASACGEEAQGESGE